MKIAQILMAIQFGVCLLIPPLFINANFQAGAFSQRFKLFVKALEGVDGQFDSGASRLEFAHEIAKFFDEYCVVVPVVTIVLPLWLAVSGIIGFCALRRGRIDGEGRVRGAL